MAKIAARDSSLASPFLRILKIVKRRVARGGSFVYTPRMRKLFIALSAGLLCASCVPSTPQERIQQDPRKFAALPPEHQLLVHQGQLARGMSPDAVYLAWGRPSGVFQGSKNGQLTERWDYAGTYPVQVSNFYGSYNYGYGGYGHHGHYSYSGVGFGVGPEYAYMPYRIGSVWFINHRVDSWERAR